MSHWQSPASISSCALSQRPFDENRAVSKSLASESRRDVTFLLVRALANPRGATSESWPIPNQIIVQLLRFHANIAIAKTLIMARQRQAHSAILLCVLRVIPRA